MNMPNYFDNARGLNGTAVQEYYSASGSAKREVYNAAFGVIWEVTKNFSLADQVTLSANAQPGNLNVSGYTKVVTGTATSQETINYAGTVHDFSDSQRPGYGSEFTATPLLTSATSNW